MPLAERTVMLNVGAAPHLQVDSMAVDNPTTGKQTRAGFYFLNFRACALDAGLGLLQVL